MTKNKILSILLSLVIAFGMWLYVVTNVSTEDTETYYNIPVVFENETVLADRNLMITAGKNATVTLKLTGSRSDHKKIETASDITIKVDLTKVYEAGEKSLTYSISYPGNVASDAFVEESKYPSSISLTVEEKAQDEIPVKINFSGSAADGFICDTENAVLDYPTVTVIGPKSVIEQIDHARIDVDLKDRTESIGENYRYTLCDADGEPINVEYVTTNVAEIHLDLNIRRFNEIPLELSVTYGGGATEGNTTIEINPKSIRASGSEALLEALEQVMLGSIDLSTIEEDTQMTFPITLPEGVANESGVTEATVDIKFKGLSIKEFDVTNITGINVPEGLEYVLVNEVLKVRLRGFTSVINNIDPEDISITIDFSGKEAGTFTFKPTITVSGEAFSSVGAVGSYSISATLRQPEVTE